MDQSKGKFLYKMQFTEMPLSELLKSREIFEIFDKEFHNGTWLDASALLGSESTLKDLYTDKIVPDQVLDNIVAVLNRRFVPAGSSDRGF